MSELVRKRPVTTTKAKPPARFPGASLMPMREVMLARGVRSRQAIYDLLRADASFPRPRRTGKHSVAWVRSEVEAWVMSLPVAELDGLDAIERRGGPARAARGAKASTGARAARS